MNTEAQILQRLIDLEESVRSIQDQLRVSESSDIDELSGRVESIRTDTKQSGSISPELGPPRLDRSLDTEPPVRDHRRRVQPQTKSRSGGISLPHIKTPSASFWMALGAGLAFVLAAVYFIRLVYDLGWLTPERQIGLAALAGVGLILGGLWLSRSDRKYAAFLPAAGIIILYLSIYSANIFYEMIGTGVVIFAVGVTTVASMWLSRHFDNTVYSVFAVVGAYLFPLLIPSDSANVLDLVIYFAAWSLLFSFISLQEKRRTVYMMAMFFSIIGFDIAWRMSGSEAWVPAAIYQFVQFGAFSVTAAYYSVANSEPMDRADALWHGIALFYFYVVEYVVLEQNVPELAPFIALASVVILLIAFYVASRTISDPSRISASATLVSLYSAAVTAHVFFFELVPNEYLPWAALLAPIAAYGLRPQFSDRPEAFIPIAAVALFISGVGINMLFFDNPASENVFLPNIALFVYAAFLYLASRLLRLSGRGLSVPLLYAGHIAFMVATIKTFDSGLTISIVWGVFAVVLLIIALRMNNKLLGQSSLLIFAASGLKVLLYDLSESPSLVRVLTLVVVGATLYAGGWIYQRIADSPDERNVANASDSESIQIDLPSPPI